MSRCFKTRLTALLSLVVVSVAAAGAGAAVPSIINYQGVLTDAVGVPLEGTYDLTFKLYASEGAPYAFWTEVHTAVEVSKGLFNVFLGETNPLTPAQFLVGGHWLGIRVGSDPELTPRLRLTSVPWALRSAVADSAGDVGWANISDVPAGFADGVDDTGGAGDAHSLDAADGSPTDALYVDNDGNVGVGTTTPATKLDVRGGLNTGVDGSGYDVSLFGQYSGSRVYWNKTKMALRAGRDMTGLYWAADSTGLYSTAMGINVKATNSYATAFGREADARGFASTALGYWAFAHGSYTAAIGRYVAASADYSMVIGNGASSTNKLVNEVPNSLMVGFGTATPTLFVGGANANVGVGTGSPQVRLEVSDGFRVQGLNYGSSTFPSTGAGIEMHYRPSDRMGFLQVYDHDASAWGNLYLGNGNVGIGALAPEEKLHVVGTVKCEVLKLTGGGDLAEPFDVTTDDEAAVAPGMVMAIDPAHPGRLAVAGRAYDRGVAGVISGANAIRPGLIMSQKGSVADGAHPVALTGRVYCLVDAAYGAVAPGDLLTTSPTPGHAMKVTDFARAQGAVLGKAMGSLTAGRGLVLVLVALQ